MTASLTSDNTTYTFSMPAGDVTVTAEFIKSYESYVDGKVKAISLLGTDNDGASQSDKSYAQLKADGVVTPVITRSSGGNVSEIGGKTTYADGIILASSATIGTGIKGDGPVAIVKVDVADYVDAAAAGRVRLSFDTIVTTGSYNSDMTIAKINAPAKDIGALTFADLASVTLGTGTNIGGTGRGAIANLHYDIEDDINALGAGDDKVLYYAFHVANSREAKMSNFAIKTTPLYSVNATADANGSLVADKTTKIEAGTEITLTPTANNGYQFKEYEVTPNDLVITDNKFEMPASNVTVKAIFEEKAGVPASLTIKYTSDGTASGTEYASVEVFDKESGKIVGEEITAADLASYKLPVRGTVTDGKFRVYDVASNALNSAVTLTEDNGAANVVYAQATDRGHDYYYYEDFETSEAKEYSASISADNYTVGNSRGDGITDKNKGARLAIATSGNLGKYLVITHNSTAATPQYGVTFTGAQAIPDNSYYAVEFDASLRAGNTGASNFAVVTNSVTIPSPGSEANRSNNYLFNATAGTNTSTWTAGEDSITLAQATQNNDPTKATPAANYSHFKLLVNGTTGVTKVYITEGETSKFAGYTKVDVTNSKKVAGLQGMIGRAASVAIFDNIEVYALDTHTVTFNVTDGTNAVEGATIKVAKTELTTDAKGKATISLPDDTYAVTVEKTGYEAPATIADVVVNGADVTAPTIELTAQADPLYDVTINTAPFASVAFTGGTSTGGNTVEAQTLTANADGVVTLQAPLGTYKATVTSGNGYLNDLTDADVVVALEGTSAKAVSLPLAYNKENMILGDDFEGDTALPTKYISTTTTGTYTTPLEVKTTSPFDAGAKLGLKSGNLLYCASGGTSCTRTMTINTTDTISSVKFDLGYGQIDKRANDVVKVRYGSTDLISFTRYFNDTYNGYVKMTIGSEDTYIAVDQWMGITFTVDQSTATASVTVNAIKYDISKNAAESSATDITGSASIATGAQKLSFYVGTQGNKTTNVAYNWGRFGLDNLEIYKAAE